MKLNNLYIAVIISAFFYFYLDSSNNLYLDFEKPSGLKNCAQIIGSRLKIKTTSFEYPCSFMKLADSKKTKHHFQLKQLDKHPFALGKVRFHL